MKTQQEYRDEMADQATLAAITARVAELERALQGLLDVTDGCIDDAYDDNHTRIAFAEARAALAKGAK